MKVYPEKLDQDLNRELRPVYLVSGEETLLVQECCDRVRRAARAAGCSERQVFDTSERGFDWIDLLENTSSLSLFAEQRLIELRIPNGKPGAEGSKAICEYLEHAQQLHMESSRWASLRLPIVSEFGVSDSAQNVLAQMRAEFDRLTRAAQSNPELVDEVREARRRFEAFIEAYKQLLEAGAE